MNFKRANTKVSLIEDYYDHFDENKRLQRKHGQVEFNTNMFYIHKFLNGDKTKKILDVGAGTGAYSIPLFNEGYSVEAIELVPSNIEKFKKNNPHVKVSQGNALDLSRFNDQSFDLIILFGPMYHLLKKEEKIESLKQIKRILKDDGVALVSYYMNDYAILTYGFLKHNIIDSKKEGRIDDSYHMVNKEDDLYSMVRISDIDSFNQEAGFKSIVRFASDGASDYIRTDLNRFSNEEFQMFLEYTLKICELPELLGASSHVVDVIKK